MDKRPPWNYSISEEEARWLWSGAVKKIEHHWKFISEDETEQWIEVFLEDGRSRKFPIKYFNEGGNGLFKFSPDHNGLISPTYQGNEAWKTIQSIDTWEAKNKRERAEYERLKAKFS